jgi:hypothetical protein
VARAALDEPKEREAAEIAALQAQARVLRDRIAAIESGIFQKTQAALMNLHRQLAYVEAQLERLKAANRR